MFLRLLRDRQGPSEDDVSKQLGLDAKKVEYNMAYEKQQMIIQL